MAWTRYMACIDRSSGLDGDDELGYRREDYYATWKLQLAAPALSLPDEHDQRVAERSMEHLEKSRELGTGRTVESWRTKADPGGIVAYRDKHRIKRRGEGLSKMSNYCPETMSVHTGFGESQLIGVVPQTTRVCQCHDSPWTHCCSVLSTHFHAPGEHDDEEGSLAATAVLGAARNC